MSNFAIQHWPTRTYVSACDISRQVHTYLLETGVTARRVRKTLYSWKPSFGLYAKTYSKRDRVPLYRVHAWDAWRCLGSEPVDAVPLSWRKPVERRTERRDDGVLMSMDLSALNSHLHIDISVTLPTVPHPQPHPHPHQWADNHERKAL